MRRVLPWVLNVILLAGVIALAGNYRSRETRILGLESSMQMLASEMRYQNHVTAQELNSSIRREIEAGNAQNAKLMPVVNALRAKADSVDSNNPAAVNYFVHYADSLYNVYSLTHQMVLDTMDITQTTASQRRAHIRLIERGVLQTLKLRTVRILSAPDTLRALEQQPAVVVQHGEPFVTEISPIWSASGFHPFEQYAYNTSRGRIEPLAGGNRARLVIPTDTLLPEGRLNRWVDYTVTITLPSGYRQQRVLKHAGRFLVEQACQ